MTLKFNRVLEVVELDVRAKFHQAKCSSSWVINSALDFGQQYTRSQTPLEHIKQSTSRKWRYELRSVLHSVKTIWWTLVHLRQNDLNLWPITLKLNRFPSVVKLHVRAKHHQAACSSSWVIVPTNFFALSRNGEKSENPVLWSWPLTYDLEILWVSCGCQGTCSSKISSS